MAVVVGGIGALAWSMRKRVRIAIGRRHSEPDFHIIEPVPEEPEGAMSAEAEQDHDAEPSPDTSPDESEPDAQDEPR
ncbi:MAG: hypothetical protein F4W94_00925 [Acidimicrobiia bacterium]|nr:hypothetical protein [Acidimicrobiia bacterium]MYK56799.1 hypothetical protein [Acidimicrobiia bacterium]